MDSSQALAASYRYDPFGTITASSGSQAAANVYRFSSKEQHVKSGFYIYLYRLYEPGSMRWLNRDPIAENGGINLYRFLYNNPVSKIDPLGTEDDDGAWGWCKRTARGAWEALRHIGEGGTFSDAVEAAGGIAEIAPVLKDRNRAINSPIDDPFVPTYGPPTATNPPVPPPSPSQKPPIWVPLPSMGYPGPIWVDANSGAIHVGKF